MANPRATMVAMNPSSDSNAISRPLEKWMPWLNSLLPGTQNDHDGVTFGEDEQPVVGVHADAMVFAVTA